MSDLKPALPSPSALLTGFPLNQKAIFFRQVATMVSSAVSLYQAVETAGKQTAPRLSREMAQLMRGGHHLSQVMSRYPFYFSSYEIHMVESGETSGNLDGQLIDLADSLEKSWQLRQEILSKLAYPVLVMHAAVFIPPLFLLITKGAGTYLATTLGMLIPAYLTAFVIWLTYRLVHQGSSTRRLFDTVVAVLPVLGTPFRTVAKVRFLDALAKLLEAGLSNDHSLELAARACGNRYIGDLMLATHQRVGVGQPVSETIVTSGIFEPMVVTMMRSGEESGTTSQLLAKVVEHLNLELRTQTHRLMTVLPVILLLAVGTMVGFIVVGQMRDILSQLAL